MRPGGRQEVEVTIKGQLGLLSNVLLSFNYSQGRYTQTCSEPTGAVAMQSRECHMQVRTSARSMRLSLSREWGVLSLSSLVLSLSHLPLEPQQTACV